MLQFVKSFIIHEAIKNLCVLWYTKRLRKLWLYVVVYHYPDGVLIFLITQFRGKHLQKMLSKMMIFQLPRIESFELTFIIGMFYPFFFPLWNHKTIFFELVENAILGEKDSKLTSI